MENPDNVYIYITCGMCFFLVLANVEKSAMHDCMLKSPALSGPAIVLLDKNCMNSLKVKKQGCVSRHDFEIMPLLSCFLWMWCKSSLSNLYHLYPHCSLPACALCMHVHYTLSVVTCMHSLCTAAVFIKSMVRSHGMILINFEVVPGPGIIMLCCLLYQGIFQFICTFTLFTAYSYLCSNKCVLLQCVHEYTVENTYCTLINACIGKSSSSVVF